MHKLSSILTLVFSLLLFTGCSDAITNPDTNLSAAKAGSDNASSIESASKNAAGETIVEIALSDDRFETLVAALQAAGLVNVLNGKGQYTVFAPTDDAFAKLPAGTVESLLEPENLETLKNILLYHVTTGVRQSQSVVNARQIRMLNGDFAFISSNAGQYFIANAPIAAVDIRAKNGVIHVIDEVMIP